MRRACVMRCFYCGRDFYAHGPASRCGSCRPVVSAARDECYRVMRAAIKTGVLKRASEYACVDCGLAAGEYDHRDYSEPLRVAPVCRGCNARRGPARIGQAFADGRTLIAPNRKAPETSVSACHV